MYGEQINASNKIVSFDDIVDIINKMNEVLKKYVEINNKEKLQNDNVKYSEQKWTFENRGSGINYYINYNNNNQIRLDDYDSFMGLVNTRLEEIKGISLFFTLSYNIRGFGETKYYSENLNVFIWEDRLTIEVSSDKGENKMKEVFDYIKTKVDSAPIKYDDIIKNRTRIVLFSGLPLGLLIASIITALLLVIPEVRNIFATTYIMYPIITCMLGFLIGQFAGSILLGKYYTTIIPDQKYAGYDSSKGKSMYKDDVDAYVNKPEFLIGKNTHNLQNREMIKEKKDKFKKLLPIGIILIILISIIVLFLGE